jgi:5-methylcytosine-specific restriction endonuclease McrBC regulatory subunit McrC
MENTSRAHETNAYHPDQEIISQFQGRILFQPKAAQKACKEDQLVHVVNTGLNNPLLGTDQFWGNIIHWTFALPIYEGELGSQLKLMSNLISEKQKEPYKRKILLHQKLLSVQIIKNYRGTHHCFRIDQLHRGYRMTYGPAKPIWASKTAIWTSPCIT